MKKTFTINISGQIFHIDEDAYERLGKYLNSINSRFSNREEGAEIISDVEARIAELFRERTSDSNQVITMKDVGSVIEIMGEPEVFSDEEPVENNEEKYQNDEKTVKRVYRDPDDQIFGGVCGGLGAYFGIDPVIVRIIFVVLAIGFIGFWIYLILWAITPKANSAREKLHMRGEKINVSNIEKTIKEEFANVKSNLKDIKKKKPYKDARNFFDDSFENVGHGARSFFRAALYIFGVVLVVTGLFFIISFFSTYYSENGIFSMGFWSSDSYSLASVLESVFMSSNVTMLFIGIFFLIGIPVLSMIFGGIKLIFNIRGKNRLVGSIFLIFWILGFIILAVVGISEGKNFRFKGKEIQNYAISTNGSDTLVVRMMPDKLNDEYFAVSEHSFNIFEENGERTVFGRPKVSVSISDTKEYEIVIKKRSRGKNRKNANENSSEIIYQWNLEGNQLILDQYFFLLKDEKWRKQEVEILLKVPVGKAIYIDPKMNDIINDVVNKPGVPVEEIAGKTWVMREDGLGLMLDTVR
ncbi:MAG: PspC domain-containing protein [Bacteroidales bacterium]|nr:PspC domain-containing protein [Bacteroidales bacterium]